ncbi:MAG: SDR family NAD(P)-dependent oxidoreductase [Ruminococcaceae bacterium]|nr:SDR family NAD(P)-dependent oxidoreductase [Oscillospiraceae bacterium]
MKVKEYLEGFKGLFSGKTVAVTGSTGGLGKQLCDHLAFLGARLILVDRNPKKQRALIDSLTEKYPLLEIKCLTVQLDDPVTVKGAVDELLILKPDYLINNAGSYGIKPEKGFLGFNKVFIINFLSPYCLIRSLFEGLDGNSFKAVCVGSIAYRLSRIDISDPDLSKSRLGSAIYGNAKHYLMIALSEMLKYERLSLCHPGITPTGITSNYPAFLRALIKYPMKLLFQSPKRASLSVIAALAGRCDRYSWIGPSVFGIWGRPRLQKMKKPTQEQIDAVCDLAEKIYFKYEEI